MNSKSKAALKKLMAACAEYEAATLEEWQNTGEKSMPFSDEWILESTDRDDAEWIFRYADAEKYRYHPIWIDDLGNHYMVPSWLSMPKANKFQDEYLNTDECALYRTMVLRAFYKKDFIWIGTPQYPRFRGSWSRH